MLPAFECVVANISWDGGEPKVSLSVKPLVGDLEAFGDLEALSDMFKAVFAMGYLPLPPSLCLKF